MKDNDMLIISVCFDRDGSNYFEEDDYEQEMLVDIMRDCYIFDEIMDCDKLPKNPNIGELNGCRTGHFKVNAKDFYDWAYDNDINLDRFNIRDPEEYKDCDSLKESIDVEWLIVSPKGTGLEIGEYSPGYEDEELYELFDQMEASGIFDEVMDWSQIRCDPENGPSESDFDDCHTGEFKVIAENFYNWLNDNGISENKFNIRRA